MSTSNKLLQAASGGAGDDKVYVEDVFSTYLYEGTNPTTLAIDNGIDLDGEGGLLWIKRRDGSKSHRLWDTERGRAVALQSDKTNANGLSSTATEDLISFNSNGFTLGVNAHYGSNNLGQEFCSWSFRKQAGFFDVVTWTGDGTSNRQITHNLGSVPGCIIVKRLNSTANWAVWHRGFNSASTNGGAFLNLSNAFGNEALFSNNSSAFSDSYFLVSSSANRETNGYLDTYVAYVFAHDDQSFGDDSDESIIKCGSYTGTGSAVAVSLGFEPQWIMFKRSDSTGDWLIYDVMRGIVTGGSDERLEPNTSDAAASSVACEVTPTGFTVTSTGTYMNASGGNYIYIAIRRPMKTPTAGTEFFNVNYHGSTGDSAIPAHRTTFPVDMFLWKDVTNAGNDQDWYVLDRLRGMGGSAALHTNANDAESADPYPSSWRGFDLMDGVIRNTSTYDYLYAYLFKRATGCFDALAYTGDGANSRNITHNLGVAPELIIVKSRSDAYDWHTFVSAVGNDKEMRLNSTTAPLSFAYWGNTTPTSTVFTVSDTGGVGIVNGSNKTYIAYLFATLAGVSKVGSVVHSGTTNVDCGFSAGARFVMVKRTDATGDWYVWDSARGIVAGNDPYLLLNSTAAGVTNTDYIDPLSSGFTLTSSFTAGTYIFLAIA